MTGLGTVTFSMVLVSLNISKYRIFLKFLTQKVFCIVLYRLLVESVLNLEAFCLKLLLLDGNVWAILGGITKFILQVKTHLQTYTER